MNTRHLVLLLVLVLALAAPNDSRAQTNPWPQFLGPTRDAVYHGNDLAPTWPKEGPPTRWQVSVGEGFSAPVVADGKVILFHRVDANEIVECLDWQTGASLWKHAYPTKFKDGIRQDNGPRSTPTLANGRVFTYGAEGELHCLDLKTGKKLWQVSGRKEFGITPRWHGVVCSPLVEGPAVLLNVGSTNDAGIVAFDVETGSVRWKSTKHRTSCSSPVMATVDGQRYVYFLTSRSFAALDPSTGREFFTYSLDARHEHHLLAASPVVHSNLVFASGTYNIGGHLLRVEKGKREKVWHTPELATQYATAICYEGCLFGVHGQLETGIDLRCADLATGEVRWKKSEFGPGTLLRAGNQLLFTTYNGQLVRAEANPKEFKELARAQVSSFGVRAYPALADGLFYVRTKNKLLCLDLRKGK